MAYSTNVFALQNTLNRFATVVRFPPLAVDGQWGSRTASATEQTLAWMARESCTIDACVDEGDAGTAGTLLSKWDRSASSAGGLTTFMSAIGDNIGLVHVAAPILSTANGAANTAANALAPLNPPSWATRILDAWKSLATWQKIGLGIVFGFGAMWAHKQWKARK